MRLLLKTIILFFTVSGVYADDTKRALRIVSTSGEVLYATNEVRCIKFIDSKELLLNLNNGEQIIWDIDDIKTMSCPYATFEQETHIKKATMDNMFTYENEEIVLQGAAGCHITIFDIYGRQIADCIADDYWRYNMKALPQGIYIVHTGNKTYKIKK